MPLSAPEAPPTAAPPAEDEGTGACHKVTIDKNNMSSNKAIQLNEKVIMSKTEGPYFPSIYTYITLYLDNPSKNVVWTIKRLSLKYSGPS